MSAGPPWSEAEERRLRLMRDEGATQAEIASALGRSIPAVIAKVAQLRLPRLVAPSRELGKGRHKAMLRAGKVTLPPLASLAETQEKTSLVEGLVSVPTENI